MTNKSYCFQLFDVELQSKTINFDCGSSVVYNTFIKGPKSLVSSYGKTFVLFDVKGDKVIGYYNICAGDVEMYDGYQTLNCGGAVHINYLALDKNYRGVVAFYDNGEKVYWSDLLLIDCVKRVQRIKETELGMTFITLRASQEGYKLYKRFGFEHLEEDMTFSLSDDEKSGEGIPMYLPLEIE